jgi:hypothetical protein
VEDRINCFERMLADNPDSPTGLLALDNEYGKAECYEYEVAAVITQCAQRSAGTCRGEQGCHG